MRNHLIKSIIIIIIFLFPFFVINSFFFIYDSISVRIVDISYEAIDTDQTTNSSSSFIFNYKSEVYNSWVISKDFHFPDYRPNKFRYYFSQFPNSYQITIPYIVVIFIVTNENFQPGITEFSGRFYIDIINYKNTNLPEGNYILSSTLNYNRMKIYKAEFNVVSGNIDLVYVSIPNWGEINNPNIGLVVFEILVGLTLAGGIHYKFLKKIDFKKKEMKKINYWDET